MNQADVSKLVSQLRIKVAPRHRNLKQPDGPEGRLLKLRKTVTGLVKHERIELYWNRADEARGYMERLISDAIRHGDCHRPTMDMADFWLLEKQLVHKLFKVLVPRFQNCTTSYTRLLRLSMLQCEHQYPRAILELRGHPYPALSVPDFTNRNLIHNVLMEEAKKEYRAKKYAEMTEKLRLQEAEAKVLQSAVAEAAAEVEAEAAGESAAETESSSESIDTHSEAIEDNTESVPPPKDPKDAVVK